MKLIQLNLIAMLVIGSPSTIADNLELTIATEMAHAIMANRCANTQSHSIEVTFETGIRMAANKSQLKASQVLTIVHKAATLKQTDRIIAQLQSQLKSGQQNCNALLAYVLDGIMPSYVAQQK